MSIVDKSVHASEGSVGVGGDIKNSTINVGINDGVFTREMSAFKQDLLEVVARKKGVAIDPLRKVLEKIGELEFSDEQIPGLLSKAADQLVELRQRLKMLPENQPELVEIRQKALKLVDCGDIDGARTALKQGRELVSGLRENASRNEVELLMDEARIDHLQLAYIAAAEKYDEAADIIRLFDKEMEWWLLDKKADELSCHGHQFGDMNSLGLAIETYERLSVVIPRAEHPLRWAGIRTDLSIATSILGQKQTNPEVLKKAIEISQDVLEIYLEGSAPLERSAVLTNMGNTFCALGERENGTNFQEQAIAAFREALRLCPPEIDPERWAGTQLNLGNALVFLGRLKENEGILNDAVFAFRESLSIYTEEKNWHQWGAAHVSIGNAFMLMGQLKGSIDQLMEANRNYRIALGAYNAYPTLEGWSKARMNLASTLTLIGMKRRNGDDLREAISILDEICLQRQREKPTLDWLKATSNRANTKIRLGILDNIPECIEEGVKACREIISLCPPMQKTGLQKNMADGLFSLGIQKNDVKYFKEAEIVYQNLLDEAPSVEASNFYSITFDRLVATRTEIKKRQHY